MRRLKPLFLVAVGAVAFAWGGFTASGQTASDYRFLEVTDIAGQPIADAEVETEGTGQQRSETTDEKGKARVMIIYGDYTTRALRISKDGFDPEEVPVSYHYQRTLLDDELPPYDPHRPIHVVLLRQAVGGQRPSADDAERRRRDLIFAVKNNWTGEVTKLIRGGVSPDTVDDNGVPIIIWASASKYVEVVRELLALGADVKKPDGMGRKALLYYLIVHFQDPDLDLVRALIRAGADVNATNRREITPLSAAEHTKNAKLIDLIKSAGGK